LKSQVLKIQFVKIVLQKQFWGDFFSFLKTQTFFEREVTNFKHIIKQKNCYQKCLCVERKRLIVFTKFERGFLEERRACTVPLLFFKHCGDLPSLAI